MRSALDALSLAASKASGVRGLEDDARLMRDLHNVIAKQPLLYCQENEIPLTDCMWEDGGCGDCARCRDAGCGWCASCQLAALLTEGEPGGD